MLSTATGVVQYSHVVAVENVGAILKSKDLQIMQSLYLTEKSMKCLTFLKKNCKIETF